MNESFATPYQTFKGKNERGCEQSCAQYQKHIAQVRHRYHPLRTGIRREKAFATWTWKTKGARGAVERTSSGLLGSRPSLLCAMEIGNSNGNSKTGQHEANYSEVHEFAKRATVSQPRLVPTLSWAVVALIIEIELFSHFFHFSQSCGHWQRRKWTHRIICAARASLQGLRNTTRRCLFLSSLEPIFSWLDLGFSGENIYVVWLLPSTCHTIPTEGCAIRWKDKSKTTVDPKPCIHKRELQICFLRVVWVLKSFVHFSFISVCLSEKLFCWHSKKTKKQQTSSIYVVEVKQKCHTLGQSVSWRAILSAFQRLSQSCENDLESTAADTSPVHLLHW